MANSQRIEQVQFENSILDLDVYSSARNMSKYSTILIF